MTGALCKSVTDDMFGSRLLLWLFVAAPTLGRLLLLLKVTALPLAESCACDSFGMRGAFGVSELYCNSVFETLVMGWLKSSGNSIFSLPARLYGWNWLTQVTTRMAYCSTNMRFELTAAYDSFLSLTIVFNVSMSSTMMCIYCL